MGRCINKGIAGLYTLQGSAKVIISNNTNYNAKWWHKGRGKCFLAIHTVLLHISILMTYFGSMWLSCYIRITIEVDVVLQACFKKISVAFTTRPMRVTWAIWFGDYRCIPVTWSTWWKSAQHCTRQRETEQTISTSCFSQGKVQNCKGSLSSDCMFTTHNHTFPLFQT